MSGVFGEYREGHFHSGVDFSTDGVSGWPVYAVADGFVYRIADSLTGFGKAVYLKHPDGNITVYAHLDGYTGKIAEEVRRRRTGMAFRERLNVYLEPGVIPVRKGDQIGLSGESGAGLPHLHFEVRRNEETPVQPFEFLPRPKDDQPPQILSVRFDPASEDAVIDGHHRAAVVNLILAGGGYAATETPHLAGRFHVSVTARDYTVNGGVYRLSPSRLGFSIDGEKWKTIDFDRVSYAQGENKKIGLLYDPTASSAGMGLYTYRLYTNFPRPSPPASDPTAALDAGKMGEGLHELGLRVEDVNGNHASGRLIFRVGRPQPSAGIPADSPGLRLSPEGTQLAVRYAAPPPSRIEGNPVLGFPESGASGTGHPCPPGDDARRAELVIRGKTWALMGVHAVFSGWLPFSELPAGRVEGAVRTEDAAGNALERKFTLAFVRPPSKKDTSILVSADGRLACEIGPASPYRLDGISYYVLPADVPTPPEESSLNLRQMYGLYPADEVFSAPVRLSVAVPDSYQPQRSPSGVYPRLGIYRHDPLRRRWIFVDSAPDTGVLAADYRFATPIDRFGVYGLFDDAAPPAVEHPRRRSYKRGEEMLWKASDRGSGISEEESRLTVDGENYDDWYYDADRGWFRVSLGNVPRGKHTFSLTVKDRVGNSSGRSGVFEIR
ncbi:M23 family metallopeptidase [bacterium]|nr:M23 family metallopeptidase [bacterium]